MIKAVSQSRSINLKILYSVLVSLLASVLLFLIIIGLGHLAVEKIYMSPTAVSARKAEIYADLNSYVIKNSVTGGDTAALAEWTGSNRFITILIYNKSGDIIMRASDGEAQSASNMLTFERMQYAVEYGKLYPMRFSDAVYNVAIGDNTSTKETWLNIIAAGIISVVCFFALILWYIKKLTARIIKLSKEAVNIGEGDLEGTIDVSGRDELSMLAQEMDNMRNSVIERMGNEKRAWEANSELITAISHDIRTPMTSLIGYLELMDAGDFKDMEKNRQFCSSARKKAEELKELTDELFKYFLVFGRSELDMKIEQFDARMLLDQLMAEAEFDLLDKGFKISHIPFEGEYTIMADALYLKRVVDNLVSNIKKYADPEMTLAFIASYSDGKLSICVSNSVKKNISRVESTKIGIRTCEKIMQYMKGSFTITKDQDHFAAEFSLPAQKIQ